MLDINIQNSSTTAETVVCVVGNSANFDDLGLPYIKEVFEWEWVGAV